MTSTAVEPMKCFCVAVRHDVSEVYVFAETAAKARWIAMSGWKETGYEVIWSELRSWRKKDCDRYYRPEFKRRYLSHEQMVSGRVFISAS